MTIPLMLGVAYALLAALLLNLNLNSSWRQEIKLAAIGLVTLLYFAAYEGTQELRGWAIAQSPILGTTITIDRLLKRGYVSLLEIYKKISPQLNEPLYTRPVRTVV